MDTENILCLHGELCVVMYYTACSKTWTFTPGVRKTILLPVLTSSSSDNGLKNPHQTLLHESHHPDIDQQLLPQMAT